MMTWSGAGGLRSAVAGLTLVFCATVLAGCGQGTRPALGTVHGKVTLDGRPLAGAGVVFMPEGKGRDSMGVTDAQGNYTLNYIRESQGAAVGWHAVRITAGDPLSGKPEPVPARYNVTTELRREVKAGENEINFDLS
jgi:hypothetical protein